MNEKYGKIDYHNILEYFTFTGYCKFFFPLKRISYQGRERYLYVICYLHPLYLNRVTHRNSNLVCS